jgi:hypothetical protein
MNSRLLGQMEAVVRFVQSEIDHGEDDHCTICNRTADQFDLWSSDGRSPGDSVERFPLWLSRVVEGVMRDMAQSTPERTA